MYPTPLSFSNYDRDFPCLETAPALQHSGPSQGRYQSTSEYVFDDVFATTAKKTAGVFSERKQKSGSGYSSPKKAYYGVAPSDPDSGDQAPVMGCFDVTQLPQTNVLEFVSSHKSSSTAWGAVSLGKTLSPLISKMGTMTDTQTRANLGTCTLISHDLVLVAYHAIAGRKMQTVSVTFGYTQSKWNIDYRGTTSFKAVVEADAALDYAIVQLAKPLRKQRKFVSFNVDSPTTPAHALLHYPLGKSLQVSVHTFAQTEYQADLLVAYHDSDYFSSGGAYFDPSGKMVAIHLGTQLIGDEMHLQRYALPLVAIVGQNGDSILNQFVHTSRSQDAPYTGETWESLDPTDHNYLIDEEGRESEKVLRELLPAKWKKDKAIQRNKNREKTITFSPANLEHIEKTYQRQYKTFVKRCLGKSGLHKLTNLFSVTGVIESDHTLPHNVWKLTDNETMKAFVKGTGKRRGVGEMPAITIPYKIHRKLLTTISAEFHQTLIDLCDENQIDEALILCYKDYQDKGLNLKTYKSSIEESLDQHIELGLIKAAQKQKILKKVGLA